MTPAADQHREVEPRKRGRSGLAIGQNPAWFFPGGPEGRHLAVVLTHDVEGARRLTRVELVAELEPQLGFRTAVD